MSALLREQVTDVQHWNDTLFSFKTTRSPGLRFKNGHFIMIGLELEGKPLLRAYSIASANHEEELEFFSIKVPDGPLTSRLQNLSIGDEIVMSRKPTGTLVQDHLLPGRNLYLLSTGTGLAPFLSIIKDPEIYENFDRVILTHGVRYTSELAYQQMITEELPNNEYFGVEVQEKLLYYPTVTREKYRNNGRLTDLLVTGKLSSDLGLPPLSLENDRFMLCGSPSMLKEFSAILDGMGFQESRHGEAAHYVIERAFVER
ncbi:ferredoxin--NADP reductase [Aestuariirhabdus sp. LZHN29]|uniref:ferredoxin--NADP reductase n=1 Tax=Aestuariirhabdus sp. LZHN29 TaxID=3417462 RepID=UPI003CFADB4A